MIPNGISPIGKRRAPEIGGMKIDTVILFLIIIS